VVPVIQPSAIRVFGNATGIGALTGAGLGTVLGTCLAPGVGTLAGLFFGVVYGLPFGLVNGVALAAVSRRRPGATATALTGFVVSGALGVMVWWQFWPGSITTVPAGLFFAAVGGMVAPRAVDPNGG